MKVSDEAKRIFEEHCDKNEWLKSPAYVQKVLDAWEGLPERHRTGKFDEFLFGRCQDMSNGELSTFKFELNQDLVDGEFRGIASAFDTRIDGFIPTIIKKGAFAETIVEDRDDILILWQHDPMLPIGKPTFLRENETGLEMIGMLSDIQLAADALELMRDGVIDSMSIGWTPLEFSFREEESGEITRVVTKLKLWEVSLVSFPANPGAKITDVNSALAECDDLEKLKEYFSTLQKRLETLGNSSEDGASATLPELVEQLRAGALAVRNAEEPLEAETLEVLAEVSASLASTVEREQLDVRAIEAQADARLRDLELLELEV